MGKIFWFHGVTVKVRDKDHNPPHVHCIRGGDEARYNIRGMKWMDSRGFSKNDLRAIEEKIRDYLVDCWEEWRRLHEQE